MTEQQPEQLTKLHPTQQHISGVTLHGAIPFDVPGITQVISELWFGGCAEGMILPNHINYLVSLYPWERYRIDHEVRGELYIRMYDDSNMVLDNVDEIALQVNRWREKGQVLVHCQAGLNRSSLIVARALMLGADAYSASDAIDLLRTKRSPACLCNPAFERYLRDRG
jgi:protein-tyrosine phosphatase